MLDLLSEPCIGFLSQRLGKGDPLDGYHRRTTIRPTGLFVERLEVHGVELEDLGRHTSEEIIILRSEKGGENRRGKLLDYPETLETTRWREELRTINRHLEQARISFDAAVEAHADAPVDAGNRRLRRHFTNGSFENGGRLFGGFWMNMKTSFRHDGIRIDGQPVIEFDYGQMALRMLYGIVGKLPPEGNLYALPGVKDHQRDGVKVLVNAMLFSRKALSRKPKGVAEVLGGMAITKWVEAVEKTHPDLRTVFHTGVGHRLQRMESDILIRVVLRLNREGITALPIHDGVMVSQDAGARAKAILEDVFLDAVGVPPVVKEDTDKQDCSSLAHILP